MDCSVFCVIAVRIFFYLKHLTIIIIITIVLVLNKEFFYCENLFLLIFFNLCSRYGTLSFIHRTMAVVCIIIITLLKIIMVFQSGYLCSKNKARD